MDLNSLTLILAIITIIPTVGGLIVQARREKKQAELDEKKAEAQEEIDKANAASDASNVAITALNTTIMNQQGEMERMSKRMIELENTVIDKTAKVGELMLAKIDAEAATATMKYKLDAMQMKFNALVPVEPVSKKKKVDTVPLKLKQELISLEEQKLRIAEETTLEIEHLKSNSIANGIIYTIPEQGE